MIDFFLILKKIKLKAFNGNLMKNNKKKKSFLKKFENKIKLIVNESFNHCEIATFEYRKYIK